MSYGSNEAVKSAEDNYRECCARLIAQTSAQLVAARDMGRDEAIQEVTEWLREDAEADNDPTGALAANKSEFPYPTKVSPPAQVAAIATELMDAARKAADNL